MGANMNREIMLIIGRESNAKQEDISYAYGMG
jgi:hypothetical protein